MKKNKLKLGLIFNSIITSLCMVVMALTVAMGVSIPKPKVMADISKQELTEDLNIQFRSAKTRVRNVTDYKKTADGKSYIYDYEYNNSSDQAMFPKFYTKTNANSVLGSENGMVDIVVANSSYSAPVDIYKEYSPSVSFADENLFIPNSATHFKNNDGEIEEIFYDEANSEDFVLLSNNYSVVPGTHSIESFYLSFGTNKADSLDNTTGINSLQVRGTLTTDTAKHILSLNDVQNITIGKDYKYWNQYFDLSNIYAAETADPDNTNTYKVDNAEGRYDLTFTFASYESDGSATSTKVYNYSFYLLDSANYTNYPTIHNATLGSSVKNKTNEYFYHFETDTPYLSYDPSRYNIAYTRNNNEIVKNITSSFSSGTYSDEGINYPYGKISYYNNNTLTKEVIILTHSNASGDIMEYVYLANNSNTPYSITIGTTLDSILSAVYNDTLTFEYKTLVHLDTSDASTYTRYTYKTNDISVMSFLENTDNLETILTKYNKINTLPYSKSEKPITNSYVSKLLLNGNKLAVEYDYQLEFDELGVYNITYSYLCPIYSATGMTYAISAGENKTTPFDYTLSKKSPVETSEPELDGYAYVTFSGYLNAGNQVTINNVAYTYNPKTNKVTDGTTEYNIGSTISTNLNGIGIETVYSIEERNNGTKLNITYRLLSYTKSVSLSSTTIDKIAYNETKISINDAFGGSDSDITSTHISNATTINDVQRVQISKVFEYLTNSNTLNVISSKVESHNQGEDKLTVFGSMGYFSKVDKTTDSGYAKLSQTDNKNKYYFTADFTKKFNSRPSEGFSESLIGDGENQVPFNQIIVTDTQVFWKNLSTMLYDGKISKSSIHRYTKYKDESGNFSLDTNSKVDYSQNSNYTYFKDIYCKDDGLYEVIVRYTYNNYISENIVAASQEFYQVFVFIIDNSSPKLYFEYQQDDGTFATLTPSSYTNKTVRISWAIPTHFQNNMFVEMKKDAFRGTADVSLTAKFDGENNMTPTSSNVAYLNQTQIKFEKDTINYYITLPKPNKNAGYNLDGIYTITLYYGSAATITTKQPSITQKFFFDNKDINGMTILPVIKSDDGNGLMIDYNSINSNNLQIINKDFTFRYNAKASGANIYTYVHKIQLNKDASSIAKVNLRENMLGLTTDYILSGTDSSFANRQRYDYRYDNGDTVSNSNYFTTSSSCLYLFTMIDDAGNEARFVTLYDTTAPRFIVDPAPNNKNNIVSDTTAIIWGDYKAIKIVSDLTGDNLLDNVTNYSVNKHTYTGTEAEIKANTAKDNLIDALSYINNSSKFNDAKVVYANNSLYLIVPIFKAQIEDENSYTTNITNNNNFYFFPVDPVSEENSNIISMPRVDSNGNIIVTDGTLELVNHPYSQISQNAVMGDDGNVARTYLTATYGINNTRLNAVVGTGQYFYSVFDALGNHRQGDLWVNLDKTQTMAYGTFNYTDTITNAQGLTGESAKSYSAAKLFISSLANSSDTKVIPDYSLTYKFYPYNGDLYSTNGVTNKITNLVLRTSNDASDMSSYLDVTFANGKTGTIQITDKYGNSYPTVSYPFDLNGQSNISDTEGNPAHIYNENLSSYTEFDTDNANTKRIFSNAINVSSTLDASSLSQTATEAGLYIFKREYLNITTVEQEKQLGHDSKIIYRVYYIDRNGIINVASSFSSANTTYSVGSDIEFLLGSTYTDASNRKLISAENIQVNQRNVSIGSNSEANSRNLFMTNKVQVKYSVPLDKHNFNSFLSNGFSSDLLNTINSNEALKNATLQTIQNATLYNRLFKLNMELYKGEYATTKIIDENNADASKRYNVELMRKYLAGTTPTTTRNVDNYLYYGDAEISILSYFTKLNDSAGYILRNEHNEVVDRNYRANSLEISFDIVHKAPSGEAYGKYYGTTDYDEDKTSTNSIPFVEEDGNNLQYGLISKYLSGKLMKLSDDQSDKVTTETGTQVRLVSTNNETLVFLFTITDDDYMAKIDTNNIKIWRKGISNDNLIFNRTNGRAVDTPLVPALRQDSSFIYNTVTENGSKVRYYAIIVFDNNLDDILNADEQEYKSFRLLDKADNLDFVNYYIQLSYIGNPEDYKATLNNKVVSYDNTIYSITIDRIKPMYNLTKLMNWDRYKYTTVTDKISTSNYETLFNRYKSDYNFTYDTAYDIERSDLEDYFFAIDTRVNSSFVFESIDKLDSVSNFYIRPLGTNINNYKFSFTPDDYKAYNDALYRQEHNQFVPTSATNLWFSEAGELTGNRNLEINTYYSCPYLTNENLGLNNSMSASHLLNQGIFKVGNYYEIIEHDEAGNYRVYGVYVHNAISDQIDYEYKLYSYADSSEGIIKGTISYNGSTASIGGNNMSYDGTVTSVAGLGLQFTSYRTADLFIKAIIKINSTRLNETIFIYYDPTNKVVKMTNANNVTISEASNVDDYILEFRHFINDRINYYSSLISDKNSPQYSEYGYDLDISIIDRLGIPATFDNNILNNYQLSYSVAGSELTPKFADYNSYFTIQIPQMTGSTYVTKVTVSQFNKGWESKNIDLDGKLFEKNKNEYKTGVTFKLSTGVYRFVIQDNFGRTSTYFHEYGISSATGGNLIFNDSGKHVNYLDGYTYTAEPFTYTYDSSVYNVFIRYSGYSSADELADNPYVYDFDIANGILGDNNIDLSNYGIQRIITNNNITTIEFAGMSSLSKYQIKAILASTSSNYQWNDELTNKDIVVYSYSVAIYKAANTVIVQNMKGVVLSATSTSHLTLTDNFQLFLGFPNTVPVNERMPINAFNTKIVLIRKYTENNTTKVVTTTVDSGFVVEIPGEYEAYAINSLGKTGEHIYFTRENSEILMYAVYKYSDNGRIKINLQPSNYTSQADGKTEFHYYITDDYFNYYCPIDDSIIDESTHFEESAIISELMMTNKKAERYIDVQVNSNLSLLADIYSYEYDSDTREYKVTYKIFAKSGIEDYIYRYVVLHFLPNNTRLLETKVVDVNLSNTANNNLLDDGINVVQSVQKDGIQVSFTINPENIKYSGTDALNYTIGNTIYVDRYYNGILIETREFDMSSLNLKKEVFNLTTVGLHEFVVRDLAGRVHKFGRLDTSNYKASNLYIYLINQILFTVNDNNPIDNQIFNGTVNIQVISTLSGLTLYSTRSLGITAYRNGQEISLANTDGLMTLNEQGFYTIEMVATTEMAGSSTNQEISSTYNFVIIRTDIARNSFNVSKGTNFTIDKVVKTIGNESYDQTAIFKELADKKVNSNNSYNSSLIWLDYETEKNSIFDITLKSYDTLTQSYVPFSFRVWINKEIPTLITSIKPGESTKDVITINYNPGLIYTQIGACYIEINGSKYLSINENSEIVVQTIQISKSGSYSIRIISENGSIISSYKFTKTEPLNSTTKIVLISVGIGVVVIVVLFFMIRKKGRYR